jgi:hypothetical protein
LKCSNQPPTQTVTAPPDFSGSGIYGAAIDAQDGITVQRSQVKIGFLTLTLLLMTAAASTAAGPGAAVVSGVVRDAQGVAQMGALVQVLGGDSAMVGTAFTDLHGRYLIAHLLPGKYEVRASAALFVPALRGNLELRSGARAVVNLTLNTLFEPTVWLPAERRKADEPSDDWKWTLRSVANRPILRLKEDGDIVMISSSVTESSSKPPYKVRGSITGGDGGFGDGGVHHTLALDRSLADGGNMALRANVGSARSMVGGGPSIEVASGYQRQLGFAGAARTVVSYQSHPEMIGSGGVSGLEAAQVAGAQRMQFGDSIEVEAGSTVYVIRSAGFATAAHPFLKITAHPSASWTAGYRMATSRELQSFDGLDDVQQELPVAVMSQGRMQTERGLHQEFSVGRKVGQGTIQAAYYRDSLAQVMVSGGGALSAADFGQASQPAWSGVIADSTTGSFRLLSSGYKTQGVNVMLTEPLTPNLWVAVDYGTGAALSEGKGEGKGAAALADGSISLTPRTAQAATVALRGKIVRSGTKVRAAYHWQPSRLVTAIDPYAAFSDQAYLSCYIRQTIRLGSFLPAGLEATVDVTNLLAQGYRPFISPDGKTLFLAQSPRAVQAGLAFTF